MKKESLLRVNDLVVDFRTGYGSKLQAVSGVSFEIGVGETLGLVGESGCGKSTIARSLVCLLNPSAGQIFYGSDDLLRCTNRRLKDIRPEIQMIFQDATASLNPGRKIGKTIEEPLRVVGITDRYDRLQSARAMMQAVGLDPDQMYDRYPFELSGGQCQRVSLARALIMKPRLLICDEPVSSLDVSVQAQILNLLEKLKQRYNLTMLFISHDLAVVKNISDRVAVMYLGKLCEIADSEALYHSPRHPYTERLLASIPTPEFGQQKKKAVKQLHDNPSSVTPPAGCRFHLNCPIAKSICSTDDPKLRTILENREVACHFPL